MHNKNFQKFLINIDEPEFVIENTKLYHFLKNNETSFDFIKPKHNNLTLCYELLFDENAINHIIMDKNITQIELNLIFMIAAQLGNTAILYNLINIGYDINKNDLPYIDTFTFMSIFSNIDTINFLMSHGCESNINDVSSMFFYQIEIDKISFIMSYLDSEKQSCFLLNCFNYIRNGNLTEFNYKYNDQLLLKILNLIIESQLIINDMTDTIIKNSKRFGFMSVVTCEYLLQLISDLNLKKIIPSAIRCRNLDLLNFILEQGFIPSKKIIYEAIRNRDQNVLLIFLKHNIDFSRAFAYSNKLCDNHEFVELFNDQIDKKMLITIFLRKSNIFNG